MSERTLLSIAPEQVEAPEKVPHPLGAWVQIVPFDDPQTMKGTNIALPEESAHMAQLRRRREMQGQQEPQEMRESKMRHSRIVRVGPDCVRAKGKEGKLCRWVGGVAAIYLNGEEVCFIRDENIFCWIEEPSSDPPVVLQ